MTEHEVLINSLLEHNVSVAIRQGPRISKNYQQFIVARDRKNRRCLLGGLGGLGVGQMWAEDKPYMTTLPGYEDAPEQET